MIKYEFNENDICENKILDVLISWTKLIKQNS